MLCRTPPQQRTVPLDYKNNIAQSDLGTGRVATHVCRPIAVVHSRSAVFDIRWRLCAPNQYTNKHDSLIPLTHHSKRQLDRFSRCAASFLPLNLPLTMEASGPHTVSWSHHKTTDSIEMPSGVVPPPQKASWSIESAVFPQHTFATNKHTTDRMDTELDRLRYCRATRINKMEFNFTTYWHVTIEPHYPSINT